MTNYSEKLCMASPEAVVRMCSVKKLLLKLCRIHRKTPVRESLLNKATGLQICNFNKETSIQIFSSDFAKILRAPILKNICERLLIDN